ncbi:MAG TPA: efflux RND transporter periplasmic adaptor subunit [Longimicrobiales bacterium]|nr:efflux RND transporter periplasmic adaptor subunit [Longimicrobiales bacterium]
MDFSRRTLSLVTLVLILGALAVGVWWRLGGEVAAAAAEGEGADSTQSSADDLPAASGAGQFATDVPQPVSGAAAVRDTLWIRVNASGQAEAFQRATLSAQVEGVVTAVPVQENQRVAAGSLLLRVDTTEYALQMAQARADLLAAEAEYRQLVLFDDEITDPAVRRERERIARSRSGLDQAQVALRQAQIRLDRTRVTAPFGGRVADLRMVPGQNVPVGTELLTVVDLDPIKVEVQVLEAELGFLKEGRRAEVRFAAYPGEVFTGSVETINPLVDPESRTGRVTVLLANADHRIKPGMYAEVSLDAEALPDRILVPRSAILERGEGRRRTMLFVYQEDGGRGLAKWRYVTTGRENETMVEIVPGDEGTVEPGEVVLVDGHHYLAHDTPVRLVEDVEAAGGRPGR